MKFFSVVSAIFLAAFTVAAQTNIEAAAGRAMSLADCIQEALAHNLDLQIDRYIPQISLYNLRSARGGYDPVLNISGQHNHDVTGLDSENGFPLPASTSDENVFNAGVNGATPWGMTYDLSATASERYGRNYSAKTNVLVSPFDSSGATAQLGVTQPLLRNFWIDGTRLTIRVAKNRLQYSEQGLRNQIMTTVAAVETAYFELIYAQENVKVQQEALNLAQTQLDQDKQRVQVGSLAPLDVQQDEAQVASSRASLIAAQYSLSLDQNNLKNLLTDSYSRWHAADIRPTVALAAPVQLFDLQDSWSRGLKSRPDLLQATLDVEQQGIQLKYYRNQLLPELDLIGTYGYSGAGREFNDSFNQVGDRSRPFYTYGATLSFPLSNTKPRNQYKAGKATREQLVLRLKQLEQNIMVAIDNAVKGAQSAYQGVEANRSARIYAEAALDAEQKKYAVGKSTTFTVLQLQNNLTAARSQEIRSLANYNQSLVSLAQEEGTTLERNEISLDVPGK
jgi:outer membrane protein TolC